MSQLVVNDLPKSVELDRTALKAVHGGLRRSGDVTFGDIVCVRTIGPFDEPSSQRLDAFAPEYRL